MILVVNAGSSSIKFSLFEVQGQKHEMFASGLAERIGVDGNLKVEVRDQEFEGVYDFNNHQLAIEAILHKLQEMKAINDVDDIKVVGFRVVHGLNIAQPSLITDEVYKTIENAKKLAPLHNGPALITIDSVKSLMKNAKLLAYFDTGFHVDIPKINHMYSVNKDWYQKYDVKKYGFHGISYEYVLMRAKEILQKENPNIIVCHLGNGASLSSIKDGKAFDTTMGLTPLAGIMMGTRSGDIDPSILAYMAKELNKDVFSITDDLNKKSGLLGVCGKQDVRDVIAGWKEGDEDCTFALDLYTEKIADFIVKMVNQQNAPIDGIFFTAGVGENSDIIRQMVADKLHIIHLDIDDDKNKAKYKDFEEITTTKSDIRTFKIRTNEEEMICLACMKHL